MYTDSGEFINDEKSKEGNVTPKFTDNHGYDEINSFGIIFCHKICM